MTVMMIIRRDVNLNKDKETINQKLLVIDIEKFATITILVINASTEITEMIENTETVVFKETPETTEIIEAVAITETTEVIETVVGIETIEKIEINANIESDVNLQLDLMVVMNKKATVHIGKYVEVDLLKALSERRPKHAICKSPLFSFV